MANYNINFKNDFNRLVMNITKINFFTDKICIDDAWLKLMVR